MANGAHQLAVEPSTDLGPDLATLLSNLAVAYMYMSDYDEALMVLDRALPLML